ncbi:MAG: D-alanine--D-alanine ligase [Chloroflexi bacterium]|nr:D-alanine--D-alanine ligase [Chloroflexota bacterium]
MTRAKKLRVGIIFGGRSGEHEVSVISARSLINAIDKSKYEVVPLGITKKGVWLSPKQTGQIVNAEAREVATTDAGGKDAVQSLAPALRGVDVAFPVVHGTFGEDGTLQGLLELMDIPYVGAGVLASAICMDKALMKEIFLQDGLPTPAFGVFLRSYWETQPGEVVETVERRFSYPCFVKPANGGSSLGVSRASNSEELRRALDEAALWDRKLLVEEAVNAREIECSVLGNDDPKASVLGEIMPASHFYDYEAKYLSGSSRLVIPAELPEEKTEEIRQLALQAFRAVDCAGMGRVDFLLDRVTLTPYLSEINTIPGFTSISMYPKLWEAGGLSYPELIDRLIILALERYGDKRKSLAIPC